MVRISKNNYEKNKLVILLLSSSISSLNGRKTEIGQVCAEIKLLQLLNYLTSLRLSPHVSSFFVSISLSLPHTHKHAHERALSLLQ